jgi:hypothetical protein
MGAELTIPGKSYPMGVANPTCQCSTHREENQTTCQFSTRPVGNRQWQRKKAAQRVKRHCWRWKVD